MKTIYGADMNIDEMLKRMLEDDASELIIAVGLPPTFKIGGSLELGHGESVTPEIAHEIIDGMMNEGQKKVFDESQECNFALSKSGLGRFRVSAYMQRNCPSVVIKRVKTEIPTCDELGLPGSIQEAVMSHRGLVVIAGGVNVGKKTSLASLVDYRNKNSSGHILTVEDPVHYIHNHKKSVVSQREVGIDTDSYKRALKFALGQAPDVIVIGELMTRETMDHALKLCQSGCLVMTNMLANSAKDVIEVILGMYPESMFNHIKQMLSTNLTAIMTQRLIQSCDGNVLMYSEVLVCNKTVREFIKAESTMNGITDLIESDATGKSSSFDMGLAVLTKDGSIGEMDAIMQADDEEKYREYLSASTQG